MSEFIFIYTIVDTLNNKVYIGQTVNPNRRWRDHQWLSKNKQEQYIHRAMAKYGVENFIFEVISTCKSLNDADETEKIIIKQYNSRNKDFGYNVAPGGDHAWNAGLPKEQQPMYGKKQSEFFKQRMSEVHKGSVKPHSEESKNKISVALIGRENTWSNKMVQTRKNNGSYNISEDEKKRLRFLRVGKTATNETKEKMSKSRLGKIGPRGEKCGNAKLTWELVKEIRKEFSLSNISKNKLAKKYNVSQPTIKDIINNITWKE